MQQNTELNQYLTGRQKIISVGTDAMLRKSKTENEAGKSIVNPSISSAPSASAPHMSLFGNKSSGSPSSSSAPSTHDPMPHISGQQAKQKVSIAASSDCTLIPDV